LLAACDFGECPSRSAEAARKRQQKKNEWRNVKECKWQKAEVQFIH